MTAYTKSVDAFPRPNGLGLIEASGTTTASRGCCSFPRPNGLGLIEATWLAPFENPVWFISEAQRPRPHSSSMTANVPSGILTHFRGPTASASLKQFLPQGTTRARETFPRPNGLGLIEAMSGQGWVSREREHFRGPTASASLKHGQSIPASRRYAHFRGPTASASLKLSRILSPTLGSLSISEAQRPRPH